jgi:hypothetical protein
MGQRPHRILFRFASLALYVAVCAILVSGCGVQRCDVTGTVRYKNKPVVCGAVVFFGADGIPITADIRQDGSYTAHNVPVGTVNVAVYSLDPARPLNPELGVDLGDSDSDASGAKRKRSGKKGAGGKSNWTNPDVDRSQWFPIPQKYERPDTSGLVRQLVAGRNQVDFELE